MALRRNVLIFHSAALGDFVLTWPIALTMARLYPQSRIFYVTHAQKGALAERVLRVESTDAETGWHRLHADATTLPDGPARLLAGAHTVVHFGAGAPEDTWARNVRRLAGEDTTLFTLRTAAPDDFAGHLTDYFVAQLKDAPAAEAAARQILRSVATRGVGTARREGDAVVIHPGSGSPRKCWDRERFVEAARQLREAGHRVRVLIGEVERETWGADGASAFGAVSEVVQPATYLELLEQLSRATAFIGNDSGPGHLAGIIGIPTLSIFGPGNPERWRPLGPNVRIMHAPSLDALSVDAVLGEASGLLGKAR